MNDQGLFALFKGDSGTGKSVAACSFPNPYVHDYDRKGTRPAKKVLGIDVPYKQFLNVFEVSDDLEKLRSDCPYETFIGDSLTSLANLALESIAEVKGENPIDQMRKLRSTAKGAKQIELRGIDYYNGEDSFLSWYLGELKALYVQPGNPRYVILNAHVMSFESKSGMGNQAIVTTTKRLVTYGRKVAGYIPTGFDEAYHLATEQAEFGPMNEVRKPKRIVITENIGDDWAKTALNLPTIIDFTNQSFFDLIKGAL